MTYTLEQQKADEALARNTLVNPTDHKVDGLSQHLAIAYLQLLATCRPRTCKVCGSYNSLCWNAVGKDLTTFVCPEGRGF